MPRLQQPEQLLSPLLYHRRCLVKMRQVIPFRLGKLGVAELPATTTWQQRFRMTMPVLLQFATSTAIG